jgi:FAD/FMN-containing dehydrogenase
MGSLTGRNSPDWDVLGGRLGGDLLTPRDERYRLARQLQLAEYDRVSPAAIAYCRDVADVRACLEFATDHGVHLTPRSGGHNFAGWSTTSGLVVDLSRMDRVEVGQDSVWLEPGVQAVDALVRLAAHGRSMVTGVCPTVCPPGFVTGGGLGFQTRAHGLACDRLLAAELVLADGRLVRTSAEEEPELFWALRGGGAANFGIVVGLEVEPVEVSRMVLFTVVWPFDRALDVLDSWHDWMASAPVELSSEIGPVLMDAASGAPPVVMMFGGFFGERDALEEALRELCAVSGAPPLQQDVTDLTYEQAMLALYKCADLAPAQRHRVGTTGEAVLPRQEYLRERHRMFDARPSRELLAEALALFAADPLPGQVRYLGVVGLGGVANQLGRTETAYVHRDTRFMVKFTLIGEQVGEGVAAAEQWTGRGFALLDPHSARESYLNYPDPALEDWKSSYYGENYQRLVEVKKAYDPNEVFTFPQSIGQ